MISSERDFLMKMNLKNVLSKIPYQSTVFWLCLGFAILYTMLGYRVADTLIYDYDGLLFHTDTAEVAEDITEFQTRNHGDTNVHPLYVLFINPLGSLLHSFLPVTATMILLNTLMGTLIIWTAYSCFIKLGLPRYQCILWTILTGSTATNLLFVSIPERHMAASLSITIMCLLCIKYPGKVGKLVWAGLLTLGVTITNFIQCGIMFFASSFNRDEKSHHSLSLAIQRTIRFGITTLALAVVLSLIQKQIWPDTRYFFLPEVYKEEAVFFTSPSNPGLALHRFLNLSSHMFVFNIVAPEPSINLLGNFSPLTLGLESFGSFKNIGWISISGWTMMLLLGFYLVFFRKHNQWFWLQMGIHGCLLFNAVMHMIYGDDFMLYTANWTFLIIIMVSSATVAANRGKGFRITVDTLLTLMVSAVVINNLMFITDISNYFRHGSSMKWQTGHGEQWEKAKLIERFLTKNQIHTLFSDDKQKWLAYATNKKVAVVNIPNERSPLLKQDAEMISGNYAFLYDTGEVITFITNSMGSYTKTSIDDYVFYHDIIPPLQNLAPVSGKSIASIRTSDLSRDADAVSDLNLDTRWVGPGKQGEQDWIEFSFAERKQVSCVKLFSRDGGYPLDWQIESRATPTSNWETVTSKMSSAGYFWSGPRIFWNGKQFHLEARFLPMFISQMRLLFDPNNENRKPSLSEVRIYGPGDPLPSEETSLSLLIEELREKKISRLYSERWVANAVHAQTRMLRGKLAMNIDTLLEPYIFEHKRSRQQPPVERTPYPIYLSKDTAILVSAENVDSTRYVLNERGYKTRETTIGPWVMFDFRDSEWNDEFTGYSKLYWGSISCFLAEHNGASKKRAHELTDLAIREKDSTRKNNLLTEALTFYPHHQYAMHHLEQLLRNQGKEDEADKIQEELTLLRNPKTVTPIQFDDTIKFLGITTGKETLSPGEQLSLSYYWEFDPRGVDDGNPYAIFVHFQHENKTIFQGDHNFCHEYSNEELLCQAKDEVFIEHMTHSIPKNAPTGEYQMIIGIYNRRNGKRLKSESHYDKKHDAIVLPVVFRVK